MQDESAKLKVVAGESGIAVTTEHETNAKLREAIGTKQKAGSWQG
jgi:hypothetical protein